MKGKETLNRQINQEFIEEMKPLEVEPPEGFNTIKRRRLAFGRCFQTAADYLLDLNKDLHDRAKLIHGLHAFIGELHTHHAWVEIDGTIVFDGTLKRFYDKAGYYQAKRCQKNNEYTAKEMAKMLISEGHYGPWDEFEARRENPSEAEAPQGTVY